MLVNTRRPCGFVGGRSITTGDVAHPNSAGLGNTGHTPIVLVVMTAESCSCSIHDDCTCPECHANSKFTILKVVQCQISCPRRRRWDPQVAYVIARARGFPPGVPGPYLIGVAHHSFFRAFGWPDGRQQTLDPARAGRGGEEVSGRLWTCCFSSPLVWVRLSCL